MPLLPGKEDHIIRANIRKLMEEGRGEAQAIAIAMSHAGKDKKKLDKTAKKVAKKDKPGVKIKK